MSNTIYTLECSRCKYIQQVSANNPTHAKNQAGHCPRCESKGVPWSTWHIR